MMNELNNKGFTLVEVLAVIVIIGILGIVAIPNGLSTINNGIKATYDILVKDITIAGIGLYEEIDYMNSTLYHYDTEGNTSTEIMIGKNIEGNAIDTNSLEVNLQTLVSNGLLTSNNTDIDGTNKNDKIITNPKTKENIGECRIIIKREVDEKFNISYQITNNSIDNSNCPTDSEYEKVNK